MITIYHNNRCSKSRQAMEILERFCAEQATPLEIVHYLQTPLSREQLLELRQMLGADVRDMLRDSEAEYAELQLDEADEEVLLQALVAHPKLLQRPIVTYRGRAVIARPAEKVLDLLHSSRSS